MSKRASKKPEFHTGKEAVQRFENMMDAVLSVSKDKILELEDAAQQKKSGAKKKKRRAPN